MKPRRTEQVGASRRALSPSMRRKLAHDQAFPLLAYPPQTQTRQQPATSSRRFNRPELTLPVEISDPVLNAEYHSWEVASPFHSPDEWLPWTDLVVPPLVELMTPIDPDATASAGPIELPEGLAYVPGKEFPRVVAKVGAKKKGGKR